MNVAQLRNEISKLNFSTSKQHIDPLLVSEIEKHIIIIAYYAKQKPITERTEADKQAISDATEIMQFQLSQPKRRESLH
jgi:hypothetical protein